MRGRVILSSMALAVRRHLTSKQRSIRGDYMPIASDLS